MSAAMAGALDRLRSGKIGFDAFYRETRDDWRRMAAAIYRRWPLPSGVEPEDVEQEMVLAVWTVATFPPDRKGYAHRRGFDPSKGTTLVSYAIWTAHDVATKWLHSQRKAQRRAASSPSRHAISASDLRFGGESDSWSHDERLDAARGSGGTVPDHDGRVDAAGALELVPSLSESPRGRAAVRAWVEADGDVLEAGKRLYADALSRASHGLRSEAKAVELVRKHAFRVARLCKLGI